MRKPWRGYLAICVISAAPAFGATPAQQFIISALPASVAAPNAAELTSGALDEQFTAFNYREARARKAPFWLRLRWVGTPIVRGVLGLSAHTGRQFRLQGFANHLGKATALAEITELPSNRGTQELVFSLPAEIVIGDSLYVRIVAEGGGAEQLSFSLAPIRETLARGADEARMISGAFGALIAMALAALLIWCVLRDKLFILYTSLFGLQALYIAYLSGQGFGWPVLWHALPLGSHAWNIPASLGGAVSCLFVREIANLRWYSPRVYRAYAWIAIAFVIVTVANAAKLLGFTTFVSAAGNLLFIGTTLFTLVVCFLAWRRGNRAAGWFLIAWSLLEVVTTATAASLLISDEAGTLLYYGMPLAMVAAAILVALGVADRLREQRMALTDAERRAQTDSLTGVLNRRSLVERLEAAGLRARARNLPLSLLFIDLDHFKLINDSFGHRAGDACLKAVVEPMQAELRQSDAIGRYGGEEFVVILSSADAVAAQGIAERILKRVADLRIEGFGAPIQLTCSIGVATSDTLSEWGEQLIASADAAVYAAKNSGRNQVQIAAPLAA